MSTTIDRAAIEKLSVEERYKLMDLIWETLVEQSADIQLSDASYEELMRRLEYARANPDEGMSLEEFKAPDRALRSDIQM